MKPRKEKPQEELFPFVEMEKLIPENHILRLIDQYVYFSFIDELVDHTYSETTGRPATDPELIVRIITIGYLYHLSESRLFEELRMHAAYRWFCNLGFHDPTPDRSTLNRLRNHRWAGDGILEKIMQNIVKQGMVAGLVSGKHLAVDGTKIQANASIKSLEPIVVETTVDEYLGQLNLQPVQEKTIKNDKPSADKDFRGEKLSNKTHRPTTDPDARLYKKAKGQSASLSKAYQCSQILRKRIEHLFAEAKICHGLDRARYRGHGAMREQLSMTAFVQNIKRLVRFMKRSASNIGALMPQKSVLLVQSTCFSVVFLIRTCFKPTLENLAY